MWRLLSYDPLFRNTMKENINEQFENLQNLTEIAKGLFADLGETLDLLYNYLQITKEQERANFGEFINKTKLTLPEAKQITSLAKRYRKVGRIDRQCLEALGILHKPERRKIQKKQKPKTLLSDIINLCDKLDNRTLTEIDNTNLELLRKRINR